MSRCIIGNTAEIGSFPQALSRGKTTSLTTATSIVELDVLRETALRLSSTSAEAPRAHIPLRNGSLPVTNWRLRLLKTRHARARKERACSDTVWPHLPTHA